MMTPTKFASNQEPAMYSFTTDITDPILNTIVIPDFECTVEVQATIEQGELVAYCTDVLVDGVSLRGGSALTKELRTKIMALADADMDAGGHLWDLVSAAEGIGYSGQGPDGHWVSM